MGFFSKLAKVATKATKYVSKIPGIKAVPILGTGLVAADVAFSAYDVMSGGKKKAAPPPMLAAPNRMPMMMPKVTSAALQTIPPGVDTNPGILPRGPGGKLQMPFSGAVAPASLQAFSLDDQYLRPYVRAPKGYVVLRDANGKPFPVLKKAAKAFGLWKPAKKPPISVKDWSALKRANSTVKKLKKVVKMAENVSKFKTTRTRKIKCA